MINWINKQNYKTLAWSILVIAILLRGIWAVLIPVIPLSDSSAYDVFAWNIVQHGTYGWTAEEPGSYWPVGTSAIYAFLFSIFGHVYWPITFFNIAVGVGTIAVTMQLSKTLFDIPTSVLAGLILAIWPSQILYVTVLASELPFTLLSLSALLVWLKNDQQRILNTLFVGLLITAASYIRPLALLLPFVFVIIEIARNRQWQKQVKMLITTMLVMVVLITPWSIRNTNLWGNFVLISTNGPPVFWMGNNPDSDGSYMKLPEWTDTLNEYERAEQLGELSREYIMDEPLAFVTRSIIKVAKVHSAETIAVHWNEKGIEKVLGQSALFPLKIITQSYWMLILITALAGIVILFYRNPSLRFLFHPEFIMWGYFAAVHGIIVSQDRYHFPSVPYIAMLSAVAFMFLIEKNKTLK